MNFWKPAKVNPDLENYLHRILQPITVRQAFVLQLKERLLANYPVMKKAKDVKQVATGSSAGVIGVLLIVFTTLKAVLLIFGMWNIIKQLNGDLRQERSSA